MPSSNLVTLYVDTVETRFDDKFRELLVASKRLERLDVGITQFAVPGGRLPPIKELVLNNYWKYTPNDTPQIWDFSNLVALKLNNIGRLTDFVESIRQLDVPRLRKLTYRYWGEESFLTLKTGFEDMMTEMVNLEEVEIDFKGFMLTIPILSKHHDGLKILRLKNEYGRLPSIGHHDLIQIRTLFPQLAELEIDLELNKLARTEQDIQVRQSNLSSILDLKLTLSSLAGYATRFSRGFPSCSEAHNQVSGTRLDGQANSEHLR